MDTTALAAQLMATFLEELEEHVRELNRDVLALEKEPTGAGRTERLTTLLRTAHSLKGAARAVDVRLIEKACHHLEEILLGVRDGLLALGPELCSLLLAAADAIEDAGARLRAQQALAGAAIASLLPRLEATASGARLSRPVPPPPSPQVVDAPLPVAGGEGVVRVRAERLDALLAHTGEMLVARRRVESRYQDVAALRDLVGRLGRDRRSMEKALAAAAYPSRGGRPVARRAALAVGRITERLGRLEDDFGRLTAAMAADGRLLAQAAGALDEDVRRVRMLPFAEACAGLERTVRDLAQAGGKEVELLVEDGGVELDRSILEGVKDPLRHLVRNAVDHGIEPPGERQRAGKTQRARITVAAALRGATVEVVVADDGRGLDLGALREQARKRRLPEPDDERELARLVFAPGLSTARLITDVSGRGVGLDVVKSRVEALHGTVDVTAETGRGTRFTLTVPLTLTTLRVLLVAAGGQTLAVPSANIGELLRVNPGNVRSVQGREMLAVDGALVPVAGLAETLGFGSSTSVRTGDKLPALLVATGDQRMAFVVDELLAEQEVVVKSLGPRLRCVRAVAGATLLPSGRIALVLNATHVVRRALGQAPVRALATLAEEAPSAKKRILLADDSITTRSLERSLLEAAGYEVMVAVDGDAAWQLLQEREADLLVSDVEMPRMDGFALTQAVRESPRLRELPVVLVTGRECEEDKARGMEAGANAYLVKSAFDQTSFLDTIAQLL